MDEKPQKKFEIMINPKIIVGLFLLVGVVLGLILTAQGLTDTKGFRDRLIAAAKQAGIEMTVKGNVSISLIPSPTFYLPGVELRGDQNAPDLTADMVLVSVSPFSLFSSSPRITGIVIDRPALELDSTKDNLIYWGWLGGMLEGAVSPLDNGMAVPFNVGNGTITYRNSSTDKGTAFDNVRASGAIGGTPRVDGSMSFNGSNIHFSGTIGSGDNAPRPIKFSMYNDTGNKASLEGKITFSAEKPIVDATLTIALKDAMAWAPPKNEKHALLTQILQEAPKQTQDTSALPVEFSAAWKQEGSSISLEDAKWKGLNSEGAGHFHIDWKATPAVAADMAFTTLDYAAWKRFAAMLFPDKTGPASPSYQSDAPPENPLPSNLLVTANLTSAQVTMGTQTWQNVQMQAQMAEGSITVNQFHVDMPGQTGLSLFGVVSQGNVRGLRFEGSVEAQGKSLRKFLTVFDETASGLPDTGFGEFYMRSNIYVSPEQLRLSEADVKISDLHLNGGLVAYYDPTPRVEADVKLKDINFDYFRDVWRAGTQATGQKDILQELNSNMNFNWLKTLQTSINFKVSVDHFTFLERKGDIATFRLSAHEGEAGIYDIRLYYPGDTTEANFTLNVQKDTPALNVLLNTTQFDTAYFSPADSADTTIKVEESKDAGTKKWPEQLIDMSWMNGLGGAFDVSIGKLVDGARTIENLKMRATLDKNLLTFQGLSFLYWQGKCDVTGSVYGGNVPGVSLTFTLYDAELRDMLKSFSGRDNITGKVSASGTIATSGVNFLSWISQANSNIIVTGRGVNVKGLNLQGVVNSVAVSRTASDVLNNVNLALRNGATSFSMDGNLNVKNGVVRTPGITLKTGSITGNLTGEVKLVPWTMDASTLFQFPAMTSDTIPTLAVQLNGPIDAPEMQVDTASLEAYVAKRITGR